MQQEENPKEHARADSDIGISTFEFVSDFEFRISCFEFLILERRRPGGLKFSFGVDKS
jgi:hypothetical protein